MDLGRQIEFVYTRRSNLVFGHTMGFFILLILGKSSVMDAVFSNSNSLRLKGRKTSLFLFQHSQ